MSVSVKSPGTQECKEIDTTGLSVNCFYTFTLKGGHMNYGYMKETYLFPSFFTSLKNAQRMSYSVEGAIYSQAEVTIYLDTEERNAEPGLSCEEDPQAFEWVLEAPRNLDDSRGIAQHDDDTQLTIPKIVVVNVIGTEIKRCSSDPSHGSSLLSSFITACQCIYAKRYIIQGASFTPEGARIFISADDEDWYKYIRFDTVVEPSDYQAKLEKLWNEYATASKSSDTVGGSVTEQPARGSSVQQSVGA